jgi:hypothetical protein
LDDRLAGLDALQVDLQSQTAALEKQQRQWEAQCNDASAAQAEESRRLASLQADIDARLRELDDRESMLESQHGNAQRQAADRTTELDRLQAELEARQREVEESRSSLEAQIAAAAENNQVASAGHDGTPSLLEAEANSHCECPADVGDCQAETAQDDSQELAQPSVASEAATVAAEPAPQPSKGASVNLAEILQRTGFNVDADEVDGLSANSEAEEESRQHASATITSPAPRVRKAVSKEDDVSIDDYMSRLLARNRGDSESAAPRSAPATPSTPADSPSPTAAKPDLFVAAPAPSAQQPAKPVELAPRAVAPEKNIDLQAMRQLANLSAKSAISTHDSKQLTLSTRTKLAATFAAGFIGMVFLGLTVSGGARLITGALAVGSFAVAALMGTSYVALTKKMLGSRTAHTEGQLKTNDEALPAEAAEGESTAPSVQETAAVPANAAPSTEGE